MVSPISFEANAINTYVTIDGLTLPLLRYALDVNREREKKVDEMVRRLSELGLTQHLENPGQQVWLRVIEFNQSVYTLALAFILNNGTNLQAPTVHLRYVGIDQFEFVSGIESLTIVSQGDLYRDIEEQEENIIEKLSAPPANTQDIIRNLGLNDT